MINKAWHSTNPMPAQASLDERITWHLAHAAACGCHDIPESIKQELKRRGVPVPKRADTMSALPDGSPPPSPPPLPLPLGDLVTPAQTALPARVRIEGESVAIVPFVVEQHAPSLYEAIVGHDDLFAYLFNGPFSDYATFAAACQAATERNDPLFFAIVDRASGVTVGHASYMRMAPVDRAIEVGGILYAPALQRTRGATEAMYLMARYVFEDLGYRRYEWKCNALNAPSRRAALRLGFTFEGIFRQHMIIKGRNRDTAWFSMLDHEWPRAKAAFEKWLSSDNFAEDGTQLLGLQAIRDMLDGL